MFNKKLKNTSDTKLARTINKMSKEQEVEKTGFITKISKTSLYRTKSFRLREGDLLNFSNIISHVNSIDDRMKYSDSQILRGLINYFSSNININVKKVLPYIRNSS